MSGDIIDETTVAEDGIDAVTLLGRLLTQASERKAFEKDRKQWLQRAGANPDARAVLEGIDARGLATQADVLASKRWSEVADNLPKTVGALGAGAHREFKAYLEAKEWPRGHLRHLTDALGFLEWLSVEAPQAVNGFEAASLKGHLEFRKDATRVTSTFVASKDMGPIAGYAVVWHWGARTWHAFLPLPLPAALVRWRRARQQPRRQHQLK